MVRGFHTLTCMGVFNHGNECLGHLEVLLIYLNCFFFFFQGGMIVHRTSLMTKKTSKNLLACLNLFRIFFLSMQHQKVYIQAQIHTLDKWC